MNTLRNNGNEFHFGQDAIFVKRLYYFCLKDGEVPGFYNMNN